MNGADLHFDGLVRSIWFSYFCADLLCLCGLSAGTNFCETWSHNCSVLLQESALALRIWHHSAAPITTRPLRGRNVVGARVVFGADRDFIPSPQIGLKLLHVSLVGEGFAK